MTLEEIRPHYLDYWDLVKEVVDENGWVYSKDVTHALDAYFESNTGRDIYFEKHYDKVPWNGYRWKPRTLPK